MLKLNPHALELNEIIKKSSPAVFELLSKKGKAIFFPKKGILAQSDEAKGKNINATIGIALEDDKTPMRLSSIAENIKLKPGDIFPYASSFGKPELRKKWKEMLYKKNPSLLKKEISMPVVTCALTNGLSIIGYLFINEEDEIIAPDLLYGNYKLIFNNGCLAKFNTFNSFKHGKFDIPSFKDKINNKNIEKKIVLLNFPNNPSGYTPYEEEVKQIKDILKKSAEAGNKILVILDDAYFGLVYKKGVYKESLFAELADLHKNIIAAKIDGVTKEDYAWGFRVGFITYGIKHGSKELYTALERKTGGAVRGNISNAPNISQSLLLKSFDSPVYDSEKKEKYELLKKRFEIVDKILKEHKEYKKYFEPLPFNSGYFLCIKLKKNNAEKVRQILLEKYSTGVIAINDLLRIAFSSTPTNKLEKLFENIYLACRL